MGWIAGGLFASALAKGFGDWFTGNKAADVSREQLQAFMDAYQTYRGDIAQANRDQMASAYALMQLMSGGAGSILDLSDPSKLEEFMVNAERVRGAPTQYYADVAAQQGEAQKRGAMEEINRTLAKFDQLPGGTELALKRQAQEQAIGATIGAQTQARMMGQQQQQAIDAANQQASLKANMANLQAMQQANQARSAALSSFYGSAFGPLAGLMKPIVPQQMGGMPELTVGQSPFSTFGNAGMQGLTLWHMMNNPQDGLG